MEPVVRIVLLNNDSFATIDLFVKIIRIWNVKTKAEIKQLRAWSLFSWSLAALRDDILACGKLNDNIEVWNHTGSGRLVKNLTGHSNLIYDLVTLTNGNLASSSDDKTIRLWNTTSGELLKILRGHESTIPCIRLISKDHLVSGSYDKTIRFWNLTTGQMTHEVGFVHEEVGFVQCLLVLDNGTLASGLRDSLIKIWTVSTGSLVTYLCAHEGMIISLVSMKKGHMASCSSDKTIKIWNYENPDFCSLLSTLRGHSDFVNTLLLLPDGYLASGSFDKTVKIWNVDAVYKYPNRSNLIAAVDD
jgi:WD40 repeat protein